MSLTYYRSGEKKKNENEKKTTFQEIAVSVNYHLMGGARPREWQEIDLPVSLYIWHCFVYDAFAHNIREKMLLLRRFVNGQHFVAYIELCNHPSSSCTTPRKKCIYAMSSFLAWHLKNILTSIKWYYLWWKLRALSPILNRNHILLCEAHTIESACLFRCVFQFYC